MRAILAEPEAARAAVAEGRAAVLAAHTFDHRAGALREALERHGLTGSRDGVA